MLRSRQGPQGPDFRGKEPGKRMGTLPKTVIALQQPLCSGRGLLGWVLRGASGVPPPQSCVSSQPSSRGGMGHF